MNRQSVAFHHLGCKVNFAEASSLSRQFAEKGFEIRNFHEIADLYVVSTCAVTSVAEKKCRAAIRQAHRQNPSARIAVIGCFPELKPDLLKAMEGVELILGHSAKFHLLEELEKVSGSIPDAAQEKFVPAFSYGDRTRSFLKIQDGCDYFCTYCTIPLARGRSRSDTIDHVVKNTTEIVAHGIREMVLTGVNIGDFGRHQGETLAALIRRLEQMEGPDRIRLSSIEPDLLSDEIIELIAGSLKFMPHFHIPLQSGCNKILKAMHRKYTRETWLSRVQKIRSLMPLACIAADVIVGFPGETDEDFRETLQFLEMADISYLHVFSYSKRENTLAAKMNKMIPDNVRKQRSDALHALSVKKKHSFYLAHCGRTAQVLFEADHDDGFMHGFSENYIRVKTAYLPEWVNTVQPIVLKTIGSDGCYLHVKEQL